MTAATTGDWVYWLLAGVLGVVGVVVLYFALLHDRSRGRKRCPKCWYDMSAATSLRCSECGKTVKRERKLLQTRRRKCWAVVGVVLLFSATATGLFPTLKRDGWKSVVPNTVLILVAPGAGEGVAVPKWRQDALELLVRQRMIPSADSIIADRSCLWDWQWRLLINRAVDYLDHKVPGCGRSSEAFYDSALTAALLFGIVHEAGLYERVGHAKARLTSYALTLDQRAFFDAPIIFAGDYYGPCQWALAPEFEVTIDGREGALEWEFTHPPYFMMCGTGEPSFRIAVRPPAGLQPGTYTFRFRIREYVAAGLWMATEVEPDRKLVAQGVAATVVPLHSSYHDVVQPNDYPKFDEIIRSSVRIERIHLSEGCRFAITKPDRLRSLVGQAVACIELVHDGRVVSTGRLESQDFVFGSRIVPRDMPSMNEMLASGNEGVWSARVRMDPESMAVWGIGDSYWPGIIEQPLVWSLAHAAFLPTDSPLLKNDSAPESAPRTPCGRARRTACPPGRFHPLRRTPRSAHFQAVRAGP
jgi:hypothetical protein